MFSGKCTPLICSRFAAAASIRSFVKAIRNLTEDGDRTCSYGMRNKLGLTELTEPLPGRTCGRHGSQLPYLPAFLSAFRIPSRALDPYHILPCSFLTLDDKRLAVFQPFSADGPGRRKLKRLNRLLGV